LKIGEIPLLSGLIDLFVKMWLVGMVQMGRGPLPAGRAIWSVANGVSKIENCGLCNCDNENRTLGIAAL
jgi:hypothetical protein